MWLTFIVHLVQPDQSVDVHTYVQTQIATLLLHSFNYRLSNRLTGGPAGSDVVNGESIQGNWLSMYHEDSSVGLYLLLHVQSASFHDTRLLLTDTPTDRQLDNQFIYGRPYARIAADVFPALNIRRPSADRRETCHMPYEVLRKA